MGHPGLILLLVGALTIAGGILIFTDGRLVGYLAVTVICAVVSGREKRDAGGHGGDRTVREPRRRHQLSTCQLPIGDSPARA